MVERLSAKQIIRTHNALGEAPTWDATLGRLIWVDHSVGSVHAACLDPSGQWYEASRWELHRPVAAAIPRSSGGMIVASGTDIMVWDEGCNLRTLATVNVGIPLMRVNDAKCDSQGRLWASTLTGDFREGAAALFRIDPDGTVAMVLQGMTLLNGLDWSPDGSLFYLVDSWTRCVYRFDFDSARGTIANRCTLIKMPAGQGIPNGITVDSEGCLWVAATGAGEVRRYSPDGDVLVRAEIPTPGATSCTFCGLDATDLCITSRSGRLPNIAATLGVPAAMMEDNGPEAGALFFCRPGVKGIPAYPFAG